MKNSLVCILLLFAWWISTAPAQQQPERDQKPAQIVRDTILHCSFTVVGAVQKADASTYSISLPSAAGIHPAVAQISVANDLFVDLPSSYGGRLSYSASSSLMSNRAATENVLVNRKNFIRDYWIVYAGMGMWEAAVNCYRQEAGKWYIVSLILEMPAGKPGEDRNGPPLTSEQLKADILRTLQDPANEYVAQFEALLQSLSIEQ